MFGLPHVKAKELVRRVYDKLTETDVPNRAAQVAFYFSFAFFPLLLFLISLFGLILESTDTLKIQLYQYLSEIMPASAFDLVQKTMTEVIENSSGGKLTLGLFVTLWSASVGVDTVRSALNAVYELEETRAWWHTKLQSLILTLMFILLLGSALGIVAAGSRLLEVATQHLNLPTDSPWLLYPIQIASFLLVMIFATAVIYNWLPCFRNAKWVWISPGAVVAIILWALLTSGFRLYLHFFNSYNKAYGSLGAVIILMLWMYLTGMAILVGGALNSVLSEISEEDSKAQKDGSSP
jgi:membrane protein